MTKTNKISLEDQLLKVGKILVFIRPTVLEGLPEYIKDLTILKAENSSHWVMHDEPDLVISKIKEFMEK